MRVVPATPADVGTVTELWVALAADQRAHGSHLAADRNRGAVREVIAHHVAADELLVAREDGVTVGFVSFSIETGRYEADVVRGVVSNLYVVEDARNRGIGGELLAAAEGRLREAGADVVTLESMAGNADARRFYREHGYEPHRIELEKRLDGNFESSTTDETGGESSTTDETGGESSTTDETGGES